MVKKLLVMVLVGLPGVVSAGNPDFNFPKTYNVNVNQQPTANAATPQVNFNPAPQANPVDAAMNGYQRGQQMRLNSQQIEMNQRALDQANYQAQPSAKLDSKRLDSDGCNMIRNLDSDMLNTMPRESLIRIIQECL